VYHTKQTRIALRIVHFTLGALGAYLLFRYALRWFLPFIVSFFISRLIEPCVAFLTKRWRCPRGAASLIFTLLFFLAALTIISLSVGRAVVELAALSKDIPELLAKLSSWFSSLSERLRGYILSAPAEVQSFLTDSLDGLSKSSADLLTSLSRGIMRLLSQAAGGAPKFMLFLFTSALGTFFISSGYAEISAFILRQIPKKSHRLIHDLKKDIYLSFGRWFRAQLILSGVAFIELTVVFLSLRIDFAVLLAALAALIDILPVLGVGTILVPWGIIELFGGDFARGATLLIAFAVILLVRSILEPKIIGSSLGLAPIAALIAVYCGFCICGILGMALFPIGLIMIKHLNDKGYFSLWK
jgi:sporulation integral membrane protein YtvI